MASTDFVNCYEDATRAEAYSRLEFEGDYYLAFRDLPELFRKYATGTQALDFGCGAGRSTRFLQRCGFHAIGVDISEDMLRRAWQLDPAGDYRHIPDDDFSQFADASFDLILSAFTFDNVPQQDKPRIFTDLRRLLRPRGVLVNLVSSPEIYWHEWASFSTRGFADDNRRAKSGDPVKIITLDHGDHRPVEDIVCTDETYRELYAQAGLDVVAMHKPLAVGNEPFNWPNETRIAPWTIYVLRRAA